jgi:hypothetical protein
MPCLPAAEVRLDDALYVVTERFAYAQKGTKVFSLRPGNSPSLIGSSCDLVQVSANRAELGDQTFQHPQLLLRQGLERPQVRANQDGYVRRGSHLPRDSPLPKKQLIVCPKPDV